MKINGGPILLRIVSRLPLSLQKWCREKAIMVEWYSQRLVVDDAIVELIENREKPDFEEFDRQLALARKAWGTHDSAIEGLAVRRRFLSFKRDHNIGADKEHKTLQ